MHPYNLNTLTHVGVGQTESLDKLLNDLIEMGWLEQADELMSTINHLHAYADCYISGVKQERTHLDSKDVPQTLPVVQVSQKKGSPE